MKEWTRWIIAWKQAVRSRRAAATADGGRRRNSATATKGSTNHAAAMDTTRQRNARWRRSGLPPAGRVGCGCGVEGWVPAVAERS